jgi:hypothetical protein
VPKVARAADVARAEMLAHAHGGGHAEAEDRRHRQEHHDVDVGRRGQRRIADQPPDPDRVDRAVERLQQVRDQRGDREGQQVFRIGP